MSRSRYMLNQYQFSAESCLISFPQESSYSYSSSEKTPEGLIAVKTLLLEAGLKGDIDFAVNGKYAGNNIKIQGKANIIIALNTLLSSTKSLYLSNSKELGDRKTWMRILTRRAAKALDDKSLTVKDMEKLTPIIRTLLDQGLADLNKQPLVQNLAEQPDQDCGDNLLKHPLFQTLSLLLDDYAKRVEVYNVEYKQAGMFARRKLAKPDAEAYDAVCKNFLIYLPSAYTQKAHGKYGDSTVINRDAIAESRADNQRHDNIALHRN